MVDNVNNIIHFFCEKYARYLRLHKYVQTFSLGDFSQIYEGTPTFPLMAPFLKRIVFHKERLLFAFAQACANFFIH